MENVNQESLQLDHLPNEIFSFYIFQYLDLLDIFKLKLISKKFNYIVNSYNIKELSIIGQESKFYDYAKNFRSNWFSTIKSINLRNLIISKFNSLPCNNLRNLQYLNINGSTDNSFKLNLINKFKKLQILHLNCESFNDHSLQLQLPDLEALSIRIFLDNNELILDTPKLKNLNLRCIDDYSKIEFRHLESVKYLRIQYYAEIIFKFINLECLELLKGHSFSPDDLLKFIKLKKFKFNSEYRFISSRDDILDDLLRIVKGSDIELVINGVKIEKNDEIEEFKSCSRLQFQLQNYSKLEYDLDLENYIIYNDLIYHLPNHRLPSDLIKKYNNIQSLEINEVPKEKDLLIYVIKECHNLHDLYMNICSNGSQGDNQEFYDQLPLISNLHYLIIRDKNLNYDFINKMTNLSELKVIENIFKNEIYLDDLKFLDHIIFSGSKGAIIIYKCGKDRYIYSFCLSFEELSLSELIKCVNDFFN